ncbi:MAG: SusD/RagB family nutrient-binding outer membrane lipoprotein [Bacteroidota bacterium]
MLKKIYIRTVMIFMALSIVSCNDVLDINESPNNPASSTPQLTLPSGMLYSGQTIGIDFALVSGFITQYWTQSPLAGQYEVYDRYNYNGNATQDGWKNSWYGAMADLKYVKEKGVEDGLSNHAAIATLLLAYQYQVLVDLFDQVPFDESLNGDEGVLQPTYQTGEEVYGRLIDLVDEGLALIVPGAVTPGAEDLMLQGDMEMWEKFGNTLKLKIYMRQSEARPSVAQNGIQDLQATGAVFLGKGENVAISYPGSTGNENPLYSGDVSAAPGLGNVNISGSASVIQRMLDAGDPRVDFYYDPSVATNTHVGIIQGEGVEEDGDDGRVDFSTPSAVNVAGPSTPVYYITGHESLFLQAEAMERGWMSGDAKSAYDIAMDAAFFFAGGNDPSGLIADGAAYAYDGLESIHLQKWLSMAGTQCVEGWAEWRRTDIPRLEQSVEGTAANLGGSTFPRRAFYPVVELANNPNAPANTNIGDPVWWDVNE